MRITQNMLSNTILRNLSSSYSRLGKYQDQLSSGKLYRMPSDNPTVISQGLNIRVLTKEIDQYLSNIRDGLGWLETEDAALMNANDQLQRARELAVQGANGTNTQSELSAIAKEIDQIIDDMVNIANTTVDGRYVFGGTKTTVPPFALIAGPPTDVTYNGDSGLLSYEVEKGVNFSVNIPGDTAFRDSTDPTSVFRALIDLRDHLVAGNSASVSTDIGAIDAAIGMVSDAMMTVGAKVNRLEGTKERLEQDHLNLTGLLSNLEDADVAEVITKLKMEEMVYQAAIQTGSTSLQKSLIDFLR